MSRVPIRIDNDLLARSSSFVRDGVEDRIFGFDSGDGRCRGVLHLPAGRPPRDSGFVLCHSYGEEFQTLRRLERSVARARAGRRVPVLRFDRRGFGDSTGSLAEASLERQLDDTRTAVDRLAAEVGTRQTGLIGARFGALLAGLLAGEGVADRLILMNPVLRGSQYLNHLIKQMRVTQLTATPSGPPKQLRELLADLRREGMLNIIGYPLYAHLYEAVEGVDLTENVGNFRGEALVMHATKSESVPRPVTAFGERITARGGTCRVELVDEPPGVTFGQQSFAATTDPVRREYLYGPMDRRMADLAAAWAG
jgi:pimeloyl-ACP methyl ester carboxylesterase